MNSMDNEIVKDLNELLRGCHMGASTFKEYLVEAQSEKLRETLKHSLDIFQKHETELTSRINSYGEDAADSTGIMAVLSEMTEKIKTMMADSDEEILNQSIKAMDMGLININRCLKNCYLSFMILKRITKRFTGI